MTIGQALKQGWSVARRSGPVIGVLWAVNLFSILRSLLPDESQLTGAQWLLVAVAALVYSVLSLYLWGGLIGYMKARLEHQPAGLAQLWAAGARYFWRLLGQTLLILLISFGVILVGSLIAAVGSVAANRIGERMTLAYAVPLAIAMTLPLGIGFYALSLLSYAPFLLIMDDAGVVRTLGGSIRFMRPRIGPIVGLLVVLGLCYLLPGVVLFVLALLFHAIHVPVTPAVVVLQLLWGGVVALFSCLGAGTLASYYLGNRSAAAPSGPEIPAPS